jgi:hypothetical protein
MRVTRESLIRIAKETVQERAYNDREIIAAYLTGSLRTSEPLLGGTTDIDLVFVHAGQPERKREFVRLSPDFHIDIRRRARADYSSLRELRGDPWLGFEMYDPLLLYEREKFFEFVQASLRAGFEFEQPPLMMERCRALYATARKIWVELTETSDLQAAQRLSMYLESVYNAANAVAELSGPPVAERRLLLEFPQRAQAAGRHGMHAGLLGLLGGGQLDAGRLDNWIADWKAGFLAASTTPGVDVRIHSSRMNYYEKAIKAILGGEDPLAALWPLLQTWTLAAKALEGEQLKFWQSACADLDLTGAALVERMQGLDHFLDEIEILLDEVSAANGLETSMSI